ncbi:MAG TPA: DUF3794 domain-containing protein [Firmicutes bacterium]|nr:DUF3794 domain-containing protein [Bacillota bacterium]
MVLKKERLKLYEVVGENRTRAVLRSVADIPAEKPDIQKILSVVNVTVSATGTPIPNKVIVQGTATAQIIYVAALPDQPVHHTSQTINFMQFVDVPGTEPGMTVLVRTRVDFVNAVMRGPRTIEIEIILEIFAKVAQLVQLDVVTDVSFKSIPAKVVKELAKVEHVMGENFAQVNLRETLTVPAGKPEMQKILSIVGWEVRFTETRVIPDKVIVEGTITTQIIYVAALPDQPVHHMHQTVRFLSFIDVPGALPGMTVEVFPTVEFAQATMTSPTTLLQEIILRLFVKVTQVEQLRVVIDVRSDKVPIKLETRLVRMSEVVGEALRQVNIRRQMMVPAGKPNVQKVLGVFDTRVEIRNVEALPNKVIVQGTIVVQIVYVAAEPAQPVHHMEERIEFTEYVDIPGAAPGMDVQVHPTVSFVNVQMVPVGELPYGGTNEVLIDMILDLFVKVTKIVQKHVVTDVSTPEGWLDW